MAAINSLLLLFFLTITTLSKSFEVETNGQWVVKLAPLISQAEDCSSKDHNRSGLAILHRYGPCSVLGGEKPTPLEILKQDQSRVHWLQSQFTDDFSSPIAAEDATLPAYIGSSFNTTNYIVTVGFGTPTSNMTLQFDTGSDLTWIQCQPCASSCYPQQEPFFNPTDSSSYLNVSCNSSDCSQQNDIISGCYSSTCRYSVSYGDGSNSTGFLARDTLTLTASDVFPNFQFGCGQDDNGLFGNTAGILGLGRRDISLVSQTVDKFGRLFSYCLPQSSGSIGYLSFGSDVLTDGVQFTPLLTDQTRPTFYFLNMTGIGVGGENLSIPDYSSPGTFIDSGTTITRLHPTVYATLRSAFQQKMSNYTLVSPVSMFDTCYDFSGLQDISVPTIVLRFEGDVDVRLESTGVIYQVSDSVRCLAFAENEDPDLPQIIGNTQQQTFDVVYDVAGERVGFGPGNCD